MGIPQLLFCSSLASLQGPLPRVPSNLAVCPPLRSAHTYSYLFSHPSRMPLYPDWMGADHADDLQYVFGKPFATPLGYRLQDRTVSKAMIAYWTNFARSG